METVSPGAHSHPLLAKHRVTPPSVPGDHEVLDPHVCKGATRHYPVIAPA